eukprot:17336-Chlamydomonas_euryale.AAC.1
MFVSCLAPTRHLLAPTTPRASVYTITVRDARREYPCRVEEKSQSTRPRRHSGLKGPLNGVVSRPERGANGVDPKRPW